MNATLGLPWAAATPARPPSRITTTASPAVTRIRSRFIGVLLSLENSKKMESRTGRASAPPRAAGAARASRGSRKALASRDRADDADGRGSGDRQRQRDRTRQER